MALSIFRILLGLVFSVFAVGIQKDQQIELLQYFNARHSSRFTANDRNIVGALEKGVRGRVEEVKKFSSGNFGIYITVQTGALAKQKVWVYYDQKNPRIELLDKEKNKIADPIKTDTIKTTAKIPVIRDVAKVADVPQLLDQVNQKLKVVTTQSNAQDCTECQKAESVHNTKSPKKIKIVEDAFVERYEASITPNHLLSADIQCNFVDPYRTISYDTKLKLVMVNNKVNWVEVTGAGCKLYGSDFRQVSVGYGNIILRHKVYPDCIMSIYAANTEPKKSQNEFHFSVSSCTDVCPGSDKKFWQIEINPKLKKCY